MISARSTSDGGHFGVCWAEWFARGETTRRRALCPSQVDTRMGFLNHSKHHHWQFNELRRAHWSTMMLLASVGGEPPGGPLRELPELPGAAMM